MYKIVEVSEGKFIVYYKFWCFWLKYNTTPYSNLEYSISIVKDLVDIDIDSRVNKRKFKKVTKYFDRNGKEYDPIYGDTTKHHGPIGH
jgi:hypothetical protein